MKTKRSKIINDTLHEPPEQKVYVVIIEPDGSERCSKPGYPDDVVENDLVIRIKHIIVKNDDDEKQ